MYRIIIFLGLSVLSANSFIPSNGQEINYTQVFFKWPQIPQTNEYQFKIFQNGESEELFLSANQIVFPYSSIATEYPRLSKSSILIPS